WPVRCLLPFLEILIRSVSWLPLVRRMNLVLLFIVLIVVLLASRAWISEGVHWLASSHFARPAKQNTDELRQRMVARLDAAIAKLAESRLRGSSWPSSG